MSHATRKVCLLGDFAVGKTSLVGRFVRNTFSDKYLTTVGVKVDTREVALPTPTNGMPYGGGPKSGCSVRVRPMKSMNAFDCESTGAVLMS